MLKSCAAVFWIFLSGVAFAFEIAHDLPFNEERVLKNLVSDYNRKNKSNIQLKRLDKNNTPGVLNILNEIDPVLLNPKKYLPLHKMMADSKKPLKNKWLSFLQYGTTDKRGNGVALPLLYSTPVLFLNKERFLKARLKSFAPPKTWQEMQNLLGNLQDAGIRCPYASTWPAWVHVDNINAILNEPNTNTRGQLRLNTLNQLRHIALMRTWQQAEFFHTFGGGNDALKEFYNGRCAILSADASAYGTLKNSAVAVDFLPLPHHADFARKGTLASGAALWVGAGKSKKDYESAALFVEHLLTPETQLYLTQNASTLPFTEEGKEWVLKKLPAVDKTLLQLELKSLKDNPHLRVGKITALRQIVEEELSAIWTGKKAAKTGLDSAVSRGNALLKKQSALKKDQPF